MKFANRAIGIWLGAAFSVAAGAWAELAPPTAVPAPTSQQLAAAANAAWTANTAAAEGAMEDAADLLKVTHQLCQPHPLGKAEETVCVSINRVAENAADQYRAAKALQAALQAWQGDVNAQLIAVTRERDEAKKAPAPAAAARPALKK